MSQKIFPTATTEEVHPNDREPTMKKKMIHLTLIIWGSTTIKSMAWNLDKLRMSSSCSSLKIYSSTYHISQSLQLCSEQQGCTHLRKYLLEIIIIIKSLMPTHFLSRQASFLKQLFGIPTWIIIGFCFLHLKICQWILRLIKQARKVLTIMMNHLMIFIKWIQLLFLHLRRLF